MIFTAPRYIIIKKFTVRTFKDRQDRNMENKKTLEEVRKKWGDTDAYKEHEKKTKGYSKEKWNDTVAGLDSVMAELALCMKNASAPESSEAQSLVKALQDYITENFYHCTDEILAGLGQMYVCDERFKKNIDKHGNGTAEFICKAIGIYCKK